MHGEHTEHSEIRGLLNEDYGPLTQRQAENIADLAAKRAEERLYAQIGRSLVRKALYFLGAAGSFLAAWLMDWIQIGPK